jgi:hypothetical protein
MIGGILAVVCMAGGCKNSDNGTTTPGSDAANTAAPAPQAVTPAPAPAPPPMPYVVAAGTTIPVIVSTAINSRTNSAGDTFAGSVAAPILVDGAEAIPKGSTVEGVVVSAKKQGAIKGEAILSIKVNRIVVRGKSYLIATSTYAETEKGKGKRSAVMTGGGAALGAIIGGIAGGGKGAAIGAGVGGGGGLAASAGTGGKNAEIPAESRVNFKLTDSVTIDHE